MMSTKAVRARYGSVIGVAVGKRSRTDPKSLTLLGSVLGYYFPFRLEPSNHKRQFKPIN